MNIPSHEYCKECKDWNGNISNCMEICGIPMDIIKEWEKYHAIGTPEECRAAVDKQKAKKPIIKYKQTQDFLTEVEWKCPTCGTNYIELSPCGDWCRYCGTKLDWRDENDKK